MLYGHMVTLDFDSSWIISVGSVPQSMQFTMEKEGQIPKDASSIQETHTEIHTLTSDPTTMHPRTIAGVVKCLKSRANRVCDEGSKAYGDGISEINLHGYPEQLTTRILMNKPLSRTETEPESRRTLCILYIRGLSKKIENICNPLIIID